LTIDDAESGCYQLLLKLERSRRIEVGALGWLLFMKGYYIYTGRARRAMGRRLFRHLKPDKKCHWHIDYLRRRARIIKIVCYPDRFDECIINERVFRATEAGRIVDGFGASDCRCRGHLIYTERKPEFDEKVVPGRCLSF